MARVSQSESARVVSVAFVLSTDRDSDYWKPVGWSDHVERCLREAFPDLMIHRLAPATDDAPGEWV